MITGLGYFEPLVRQTITAGAHGGGSYKVATKQRGKGWGARAQCPFQSCVPVLEPPSASPHLLKQCHWLGTTLLIYTSLAHVPLRDI